VKSQFDTLKMRYGGGGIEDNDIEVSNSASMIRNGKSKKEKGRAKNKTGRRWITFNPRVIDSLKA